MNGAKALVSPRITSKPKITKVIMIGNIHIFFLARRKLQNSVAKCIQSFPQKTLQFLQRSGKCRRARAIDAAVSDELPVRTIRTRVRKSQKSGKLHPRQATTICGSYNYRKESYPKDTIIENKSVVNSVLNRERPVQCAYASSSKKRY